jgi:Lrp/AsnC family transcriptional regulator, regulator for asnA, asnC and gidA
MPPRIAIPLPNSSSTTDSIDTSALGWNYWRVRRRLVSELGDGGGALRDSTRPVALDDISKQIIEELQHDGRASYAALAKLVGLSEAAVRQRVQRLLDTGVMQIVAVTDPATVGFTRHAMIGVKTDGDVREIADKLAELQELDYVVVCTGSFDLLVELVCEDDEHLFDLLNDRIRSVPGVVGTETFVYLRLIKQTYAWGTR